MIKRAELTKLPKRTRVIHYFEFDTDTGQCRHLDGFGIPVWRDWHPLHNGKKFNFDAWLHHNKYWQEVNDDLMLDVGI